MRSTTLSAYIPPGQDKVNVIYLFDPSVWYRADWCGGRVSRNVANGTQNLREIPVDKSEGLVAGDIRTRLTFELLKVHENEKKPDRGMRYRTGAAISERLHVLEKLN
jgi:hypothetical protein